MFADDPTIYSAANYCPVFMNREEKANANLQNLTSYAKFWANIYAAQPPPCVTNIISFLLI